MTIWERVRNILLKPKAEWRVIESEATEPLDLYKNYIVVLALIPALSNLALILLFSALVGLVVSAGTGTVILSAIVGYLISLAVVYVVAVVTDVLAPIFGGVRNHRQALKLTAYSMTALWITGVAVLVPMLGGLVALVGAAYTVYLLFLGAPVMMKIERKLALPYVAMIVVIALAIAFIASMLHVAIVAGGVDGALPQI